MGFDFTINKMKKTFYTIEITHPDSTLSLQLYIPDLTMVFEFIKACILIVPSSILATLFLLLVLYKAINTIKN